MKVHDQVLHAAQRLCAARGNFNFALKDAVEALPQLKATPAVDTIRAVISESDGMYVVKCLEMPVVSQGTTLDETVANLREALALQLEGDTPSGLVAAPRLAITYETALAR